MSSEAREVKAHILAFLVRVRIEQGGVSTNYALQRELGDIIMCVVDLSGNFSQYILITLLFTKH